MNGVALPIGLIRAQISSTRVWLEMHKRHNDRASHQNAAIALGKFSGMYDMLLKYEEVIDLPVDVVQANEEFRVAYGDL